MSKLIELIRSLCPEGVEYREIESLIIDKSIFTISPPGKLTKNLYRNVGAFPIIDQGQDFIVGYTDDKEITINDGLYVVFGDHTEAFKYIDFAFAQGADGIKILSTDNEKIIPKYLFIALNNFYIKTGKYTRHFSFLRKTFIPIPPLPIQQEIVTILDTFIALDGSLQAELEARRKQYEHYRNELLNFEGKEVEWKTLGEITSLITKGTTPKRYTQSGVSFIKTEAFDGSQIDKNKLSFIDEITHKNFLKRSILKSNDILFTIAGATIGKIAIVTDDLLPANTNQALAIIRLAKNFNTKYVFYILKSKYMKQYIFQSVKGSAQPNLNLLQMNDFPIPIPPLAEQERIVGILDKFDALVNKSLPAEIAARRKQYEYYREKLLTFKSHNP
ncbi:MAG: restriction endonuclease subunit S [Paludibacteraceae bacterium]